MDNYLSINLNEHTDKISDSFLFELLLERYSEKELLESFCNRIDINLIQSEKLIRSFNEILRQ